MRTLFIVLIVIGVVGGDYYAYRLSPLFTTNVAGADKVVLLHGLGRNETAMLLSW